MKEEVGITRTWAMPSRWTFSIKPIKELLQIEKAFGLFKEGKWCDPFSGKLSPADVKNDLNPDNKADFHLDALEFLKLQKTGSFDGVLFDPPYSITQATRCYQKFGKDKLKINVANQSYWVECKNQIARIVKPGGKVISFGWNTNGIGKQRKFAIDKILIVAHGGSKNDTLVTVEKKAKPL